MKKPNPTILLATDLKACARYQWCAFPQRVIHGTLLHCDLLFFYNAQRLHILDFDVKICQNFLGEKFIRAITSWGNKAKQGKVVRSDLTYGLQPTKLGDEIF